MKCPKCRYLGFEHVDRCRNCGYDFALAAPSDDLELPLRKGTTERQPLEDIAFLDAAMGTTAPASADSTELPLFGAVPDDLPLITRPSAPRPPLAVRRSTPEAPRPRSPQGRPPTLDLGFDPASHTAVSSSLEAAGDVTGAGADAPIGARLMAVVTDLSILAAIDVAVIYFTMQICGLGPADLSLLPRAPLIAFMLVQNGGYLVAFTAGGQTLGKMAAGIKVVTAEPRVPLDLGRAFIRELVWLGLAVPAGLGLLTVLRRDRRGVHDRFAGTRVVRA